MVAYAKYKFFWTQQQDDGATTQEHYDKARNNAMCQAYATEETFEDIPEEVNLAFELSHIWDWFHELDSTRQMGFMSVQPITHAEITSWAEGMGLRITPFERQAICAIDRAYRIFANSKSKSKK